MNEIRPYVKCVLAKKSGFFGPGGARLLEYIKQCGSVKEASYEMGVSYSKAWKLIYKMEKELNLKIIERTAGGKNGGASSLTSDAEEFLKKFRLYEKEVKKSAEKIYKDIFE